MTIGDATKTLASRIWDTWIPFGTESETEVTTVANCRIPLADILAAGKPGFLPEAVEASQAVKGLTRTDYFLLGYVCRKAGSGHQKVPVMARPAWCQSSDLPMQVPLIQGIGKNPGCHSSIWCISDELKAAVRSVSEMLCRQNERDLEADEAGQAGPDAAMRACVHALRLAACSQPVVHWWL